MTDPKNGDLFAPWLQIWWLQLTVGFSRWHSDKESTCPYRRCKICSFNPWAEKIPWRREWQPTPVVLPGKFHGESSLAGYNPWDHKELDTNEWLSTHTLLKTLPCVLSHVQLLATLWTVAHQAPLSMGFYRQEHWNGFPCPPPGDLPDSEMKP